MPRQEQQWVQDRYGNLVNPNARPSRTRVQDYDDRDADLRSSSSIRTRTTTQRPVADVLYEEEDDEYETEPVVRPVQRASRAPQRTVTTQQQPRQGGRPQQQMEYYPEDQPQPRPGRRPRRVTAEDAVILEGFADRAIDPRDRHSTSDYAAPTERFTGPQMPAVVPDRPVPFQGIRNRLPSTRREFIRFGVKSVAVLGAASYGLLIGSQQLNQFEWQQREGNQPMVPLTGVFGHNHDSRTHPTELIAFVNYQGYIRLLEYPAGDPTKLHDFTSDQTMYEKGYTGRLDHIHLELEAEAVGPNTYNIIITATATYTIGFQFGLIPPRDLKAIYVLTETGKGYFDVPGSKGGAK